MQIEPPPPPPLAGGAPATAGPGKRGRRSPRSSASERLSAGCTAGHAPAAAPCLRPCPRWSQRRPRASAASGSPSPSAWPMAPTGQLLAHRPRWEPEGGGWYCSCARTAATWCSTPAQVAAKLSCTQAAWSPSGMVRSPGTGLLSRVAAARRLWPSRTASSASASNSASLDSASSTSSRSWACSSCAFWALSSASLAS